MSGHEKKPLVPPLRFPEFRDAGEWESKPLKFMGSFFRGLTYSADEVSKEGLLVLRSSNIQDGTLVLDKDLVFVNKTCPDDIQLRSGDIAICMSNGSKALVGKNAEFRGNYDHDLTVGAFCSIFRPSVEFSKLIFQTPKYTKFISVAIGGGNINNLKNSDLGEFEHPVPKLQPEQQKIADCLSSLDELIAAENQKLEILQTHCAVLMQQILPREGEAAPRLRFPEFRKRSPWKSKTLSEIAAIRSGSTPSRAEPAFYSGGTIPWVKTTDLNNGFIVRTEECVTPAARVKVNPVGSVLVAMYGGFKQIGRTGYLTVPAATNQAISVLNADENEVLPIYLLTWMNARVGYWKIIASSSRKDPNITGTDVANFPISYPDKDEQQKIADTVASVNRGIEAQIQKITCLTAHKTGLLQQLFPAVGEVPA
ncbi:MULTISPECIES: restriction endonuclease subunit S [Pseudomonas aeruginosa group]|uniref:restriction endonuclease subunit S n=1 Tax=Pseudomonas aeruginosa group TaxID=136841 RepID=UPI0008FB8D15|nr:MULTISPECIES: restriction endonuclease subunit S [Pseudomonas aeruginosa group]EKP5709408.1 restriction endonuclease subunit S [Pseudomonas aeruginosa]EKV8089402.1 restriction endonuclease subunit S [Pseudomonas aeruginosa]EKW5160435.1 restriction endonuclease subunit S [Pseudomonas aeruginosa]EKW6387113.1 restriction endonuclease subunit S [Pseudomonas aeruginosa]EKW6416275.1 restriction endonuclease subunit S [Pseudomonas aeruginosa]